MPLAVATESGYDAAAPAVGVSVRVVDVNVYVPLSWHGWEAPEARLQLAARRRAY
jgi:hypothetical protein